MKERQIEIDKAIAYFLGWRIDNSFPDKGKVWRNGNSVELETTFKFSTDWNLLMEVYEAVNNLKGYSTSISPGHCSVSNYGELDFEDPHKKLTIVNSVAASSMQEAVYKCLGEFIESYNKEQLNVGPVLK